MTGAAGFIGSHLTDTLLEKGAVVIGIDNLYNGQLDNLKDAIKNPNFTFYKTDIRDYGFLFEICKDIDIIYHEAAFSNIPQSINMPTTCNDININGTIAILNVARIRDVNRIIFASSAAVYGDISSVPMIEDEYVLPISPYGVSKLCCEKYFYAYFKNYGINTVSLRYFNVYGPRQKFSPYSGVITIFLRQISRNENFIIYGDGEQKRDFIYIKDVVNANLLAGVTKNISGEVFNIGIGIPISINQLATIIKTMWLKEDIKINYTDSRPGDIKEGFADITKAKNKLKFKPNYDIHLGLKDYMEWISSKNLSK